MATSGIYKGVFLDVNSLDKGDLDLTSLKATLPQWSMYEATDPNQVLEHIEDADVVVSNKVVLNADAINAASRLKLICVAATGTNNIDLAAATTNGVSVCNVRGYGTPSVTQHTFMLMLALATHFPRYQKDLAAGHWQRSDEFCLMQHPILELSGKTLAILGYGELGQAVATLGQAFGMNVIVSERPGATPRPGRVSWEQCLTQADVLSLHCLLTPETQHLINQATLSQMKPTALLINTARGGLVDELALLKALESGEIAGAGLDVLSEEPPVNGNLLLEASLDNLIITPHNAWASLEARQRMVNELSQNIERFLAGEVRNQVL